MLKQIITLTAIMKLYIFGLVFVALFVFTPFSAGATQSSLPYLYEQLNKPSYKLTFNALFKGQHKIEPWLKQYLKNRNGVDSPGEARIVNNKTYEFYTICQPHNCPGNVIYVVFEPDGKHAWVYFTKEDGTSRFFGNPDKEMQAILKAAVN